VLLAATYNANQRSDLSEIGQNWSQFIVEFVLCRSMVRILQCENVSVVSELHDVRGELRFDPCTLFDKVLVPARVHLILEEAL